MRAAPAHRWREGCCTSAEMRWSRRRRRRGPRRSGVALLLDRVLLRRQLEHRFVEQRGQLRRLASGGQLGDFRTVVQPGSSMLRTTETSSSPSRINNRGSRSSPACRRKSRTLVASPWRTSTRPAALSRLSASRTAGRDTPSTSASRRSLGSVSPGCISPQSSSVTICSKTPSGPIGGSPVVGP